MKTKKLVNKIARLVESYTLLLPAYIIFTLFIFVPVARAFYYSLFDYSLLSFYSPKFVGLGNFQRILSDRVFWIALRNTAVYAFGTVPTRIILALFLAVLLDSKYLRGKELMRTAYFLPVVTSMVASAIMWRLVFDASSAGLANRFVALFGLGPKGWLADSKLAMFSVIVMSIWKDLGYCMLIYTAGLQGIPVELYEGAAIDGGSPWRQFIYITLPLLKPTTFFVLTTQIISSFQVFTQTYVMTGGGPGYSTTTLINLLYDVGFKEFRMGYASALALMLFVGLLLITIIQKKAFKADELTF